MELQSRYQSIYNKAIVKKSNIELLLQQLEDETKDYESHKDKLKQILEDQITYENSIDVLKKCIEHLSKGHIQHLNDLLNSAIQTIFFDRQYSIELRQEEFKNKNTLKVILHEFIDNQEVISDINDNGYGVKSIIGFILQVYFILYYKQTPILFLDEAFSNLSSQYLPYWKSLLQELTKKYGFHFVLITHDERLKEYADRTYLVRKGVVTQV